MHGRRVWLARSTFGVDRVQVRTDRAILGHPVSVDGAFPPSFRRVVNGNAILARDEKLKVRHDSCASL